MIPSFPPFGRARVGFFFSSPVITMIPLIPSPWEGQGGLRPGWVLYLNLTSSFMLSLYSLLLIRSSMFTCMR